MDDFLRHLLLILLGVSTFSTYSMPSRRLEDLYTKKSIDLALHSERMMYSYLHVPVISLIGGSCVGKDTLAERICRRHPCISRMPNTPSFFGLIAQHVAEKLHIQPCLLDVFPKRVRDWFTTEADIKYFDSFVFSSANLQLKSAEKARSFLKLYKTYACGSASECKAYLKANIAVERLIANVPLLISFHNQKSFDLFRAALESMFYRCPHFRIFIYTPFEVLVRRVQRRNTDAIKGRKPVYDLRISAIPLTEFFSNIQPSISSNALDFIDRKSIIKSIQRYLASLETQIFPLLIQSCSDLKSYAFSLLIKEIESESYRAVNNFFLDREKLFIRPKFSSDIVLVNK